MVDGFDDIFVVLFELVGFVWEYKPEFKDIIKVIRQGPNIKTKGGGQFKQKREPWKRFEEFEMKFC